MFHHFHNLPIARISGYVPVRHGRRASRGFDLAVERLEGRPLLSLSISDATVVEGDGGAVEAVFTVSLSTASAQAVTVQAATADGTARAPGDYTALPPTTLTFAPGETTKTIAVSVNGDTASEGHEIFFVNLSNPTNDTIADRQGSGRILNDDGSIGLTNVIRPEGNSGTTAFRFTVFLGAASTETITVEYATADGSALAGSDYTATGGTLTFAPGETTKAVDVPVRGDTAPEPNETFFLDLSNPTNAIIADSRGFGSITNDDATLVIDDVVVAEGDGGAVDAVFTVTLTAASAETVTVDFATADTTATAGSDYTPAGGTLTFAPGETTKTVAVAVHGDTAPEPDEVFAVDLSNPTNALLADRVGLASIRNDDATISVADASSAEGNGGTSAIEFVVSLPFRSTEPVAVDFATADGGATAGADYVATAGTLTFDPGETEKAITVAVVGDTGFEADEDFFIVLSNPVNASLGNARGLGVIINDDSTLSLDDVIVVEGDGGAVEAVFTVSLSAASVQAVTVQVDTADVTASAPGDYTALPPTTLTFAPGETTKTVAVAIHGDSTSEGDETFFINLSNPDGATVVDGRGIGLIRNDDGAISVTNAIGAEGDGGTTAFRFHVLLRDASTRPVTVRFAAADGDAQAGSDYTAAGGTLTFDPGETLKVVDVLVHGDTAPEPNETFFLDLSSPTNAIIADDRGFGSITNDDTGLVIGDVEVIEGDGGAVDAVFTASLTAPSAEVVTVDFATSDVNATAGSDYAAAGGTLTFAPGETTKTIVVAVSGDTAPEPDEVFAVDLSNPSNAILVDDLGLGSIRNDDAPTALQVTGFDVQKGATQRSFVRFLDVTFDQPSGVGALVESVDDADPANDRMRLVRLELDGTGGDEVAIANRLRAVDRVIAFDFGESGITGDPDSTAGDGYYELRLDLDGDGSVETTRRFYRLLGDINADQQADIADVGLVTPTLGAVGPDLATDVNGDGVVSAFDRTLVRRSRGRRLSAGLLLDD